MLASDYDVHVARIARRVVNALVQYLDQARLLFKRPEQLAHPLDVDKFRFRKDVGSSINVNVAAGFLPLEASFTQQNRVLQQSIVKRFLFLHQLDNLGADREEALATELCI